MSRVYLIHGIKRAANYFLPSIVFTLSFIVMWPFVSFSNVLENQPAISNVMQYANFFFGAVMNTEPLVQGALLAILGALFYVARATVRNLSYRRERFSFERI